MRMFVENDDHHNFLRDCVDKNPSDVCIATFGIYAGITFDGRDTCEWGEKYQLNTRDIITDLENTATKILVGIQDYRSCKGYTTPCLHCERQYSKAMLRLLNHADMFSNIEWRMTTELHLKCCLFSYDDGQSAGVAGGRNFTDSSWVDVTFELEEGHIKELRTFFDHLWSDSLVINERSLVSVLESQRISEEGFNYLAL